MAHYVSVFLVSLSAIFFVVDPIGIVPLFLTMTAGDPPEKVRRTARRACAVAGGLMLFFALFGGLVFKVFGVSLAIGGRSPSSSPSGVTCGSPTWGLSGSVGTRISRDSPCARSSKKACRSCRAE